MKHTALGEYLNAHLSGAELAMRLLARLSRRYGKTPMGLFFTRLLRDISADQNTLIRLIRRLNARPGLARRAAGRLTEVISRPKLTPRPGSLGLFESLEALALGIQGKHSLWKALQRVAPLDRRLDVVDLAVLERRAVEQYERVEDYRLSLATEALVAADRRRPTRRLRPALSR